MIWQFIRFKVNAPTKQQRVICVRGIWVGYSGNMTNLLYQLWICYMEEHKALKYRDYRDKLYMIIGTENFDDTHP